MDSDFACIRESDLFSHCSPEQMSHLESLAPAQFFSRGELIFSRQDQQQTLFILKKGRIRVFRIIDSGKTLTIAILTPGMVFGEMALMGQSMHENYAEALEECQVCALKVSHIEELMKTDPQFTVQVSKILAERVQELEERLSDNLLRPLPARIARVLLKTLEKTLITGKPIVRLTHEQIANLVGVSREITSKTLADFATQGIVRQGRGKVILTDMPALYTQASIHPSTDDLRK
ncbi:Crp/Fnr family transcriptional regulator [Rothia sp. P7208]|uniref:Crp/Fnr family transcriptional regulator n=1 Tax=Rothia sp. P7208 TaxID=3402660 RepID=UPI003AD2E572